MLRFWNWLKSPIVDLMLTPAFFTGVIIVLSIRYVSDVAK